MKRLFSQTVKTCMGLLLFCGIVVERIVAQTRLEDLDAEEFSKSFETRYIPSENMTPTLEIGDRLLIDKKTYQTETPQRKDLVILALLDRGMIIQLAIAICGILCGADNWAAMEQYKNAKEE